jgi:HAD superfamily hydrolase (TIGR01509 family)
MQKTELVIFDCDGVLVDSELIVNQVFLEELNKAGVPIKLNTLLNEFVGHSLDQCLNLIKKKYGFSLGHDFLTRYKVRRDLALESRVKAIEGVENLIQKLKLPYCVASNSEASKVRKMLTLTGLIGYFDGKIFSAADMGKPKPAPDVYLQVASEFSIKSRVCLVIEDTPTGVRAGVAAGMKVFGYSALTPEKSLIEAGASQIFHSMTELQQVMSTY